MSLCFVAAGTVGVVVIAFLVVSVLSWVAALPTEQPLPATTETQAESTGSVPSSIQSLPREREHDEVSAGLIVHLQSLALDNHVKQNFDSLPAVAPESVLLDKTLTGKQTRSLNCEFQTASDLAWYYGLPYTWEEIFQLVGHDPGGNPHVGFVGRSFDDSPGSLYPQGYGVYAEPIAVAFQSMGLKAEVHYRESADWLRQQLAAGRPVMVWATSQMVLNPVESWVAADGAAITAVRGEHTFLVVGYNPEGVWVNDPWDGERHFYVWPVFLASWDRLDRMALLVMEDPENHG